MLLESISLGIFNHLFLTGILSILSIVISIIIYWLTKRDYLPKLYNILTISFVFMALHWFAAYSQLFFATQFNDFANKASFYTSFTLLSFAVTGILYFVLRIVYSKLSVQKSLILAATFGILPSLTVYFTENFNNGLTIWDSSWLISNVTLISFGIGTILPVSMGLLMLFIHAFDSDYKDKFKEKLIMKVGAVLLILYFFIIFLDYYFQMNGGGALWSKMALLGLLFLFLFIILHKKIRIYNFKVDIKLRNPLMLKAIFFSLFTTIVPLFFAAYLLTISFQAIIVTIVKGNFSGSAVLLEQQIIMTSIVLGFFSFFISLLIIKLLENKIKMIIQGMYEVLNNNFEYRIRNAKPVDELGSLSLSFNDMAKDLDGYSIEIDKYSNILEDKVKTRTTELEKKSLEAKTIIDEINKNSERLTNQTDLITNQMQDGLLVLDKESKITRYNQAVLKSFNLDEADYLGQAFLELEIIKKYEEFKLILDKFHNEKLDTYQQKVTLKPPLSGMLECRLTRLNFDEDKDGVIMVLRDISLPWGIVYDAESKETVSAVIVRLYNESNNKIIAEEITDDVGRFMFYVNPGNYYVRLFKDGYNFPSKTGVGYHGEVITIEDKKDSVIHFDVLIDKLG